MTLEFFEDCLDRYGVDFATWPDEARQEAERLIVGSAEARHLFSKAERLDRLFQPSFVPSPPSVAAIVAYATTSARLKLMARVERALGFDLFGFGWMHAGGLAACLAIGLAIGTTNPAQPPLSAGLLDLAMGAHLDQVDD